MPTPYSGIAGASQSPSPQPAELAAPIINIPTGGDRGAAVWTQPLKTIADWIAFLAASLPPASAGNLLRAIPLTSGTSLAKSPGCTRARVRMVGGGAGGGGTFNSGGGAPPSAGGGGSAGGYAEYFTTTIPATWVYAIGAGGAAGTAIPGDGGNGGNTTFSDGVTTVTAFGGNGVGTGVNGLQGDASALSANGTINGSGAPAERRGPYVYPGRGGSSLLGGIGGQVSTLVNQTPGNSGVGPGAGGSGAFSASAGGSIGGAGTGGMIVLEEYS